MILIINCTKGFEFALIQKEKTIVKKKSKQLKNISEKLVLEIAKEHLQSSFDITKSIGFQEWVKAQSVPST